MRTYPHGPPRNSFAHAQTYCRLGIADCVVRETYLHSAFDHPHQKYVSFVLAPPEYFLTLSCSCCNLFPRLVCVQLGLLSPMITNYPVALSLNARNWLATAEVTEMDQIQPFTTSLMPNAQASSASGSIAFRAKLSRVSSPGPYATCSTVGLISTNPDDVGCNNDNHVAAAGYRTDGHGAQCGWGEGAVRDYLDIKAAAITESSTASLAASV